MTDDRAHEAPRWAVPIEKGRSMEILIPILVVLAIIALVLFIVRRR
jgi:hypothetical protein